MPKPDQTHPHGRLAIHIYIYIYTDVHIFGITHIPKMYTFGGGAAEAGAKAISAPKLLHKLVAASRRRLPSVHTYEIYIHIYGNRYIYIYIYKYISHRQTVLIVLTVLWTCGLSRAGADSCWKITLYNLCGCQTAGLRSRKVGAAAAKRSEN